MMGEAMIRCPSFSAMSNFVAPLAAHSNQPFGYAICLRTRIISMLEAGNFAIKRSTKNDRRVGQWQLSRAK